MESLVSKYHYTWVAADLRLVFTMRWAFVDGFQVEEPWEN